jgi:hypothetical protein
MARYLDDQCPSRPQIPLCPYVDEVRTISAADFLWADDALAWRTQASDDNAEIYAQIARDALIDNLPQFIIRGLRDSWELLKATSLDGDQRDDNLSSLAEASSLSAAISDYYSVGLRGFLVARQQQGILGAERFHSFYRAVTYASYLAFAILIWWWAQQGNRELAAAGVLMFMASLLNALVFGSLGGPYIRYQVRLACIVLRPVLRHSAGLIQAANFRSAVVF